MFRMKLKILAAIAMFSLLILSSSAVAQDVYDNYMPRSLSCEEAYRNTQAHESPVTVTGETDDGREVTLTYNVYNKIVSLVEEKDDDGYHLEGTFEYYEGPDGCEGSGYDTSSETWELMKDGKTVGKTEFSFEPGGEIAETSDDGEDFPIDFSLLDVAYENRPDPTRECDATSTPIVLPTDLLEELEELPTEEEDAEGVTGDAKYDDYGRLLYIEQGFPFDFSANTSYEYFDRTYLLEDSKPGECYYRERVSSESGSLFRGDATVASYTVSFDETGKVTERSSEGFAVLRWLVLNVLAPLLGYETVDEEGQNWVRERFGEEIR